MNTIRTLMRLCILVLLTEAAAHAQYGDPPGLPPHVSRAADWQLLSLQGGTSVRAGEVVQIRWTRMVSDATMDVLLWDGARGGWQPIARQVPCALGSIEWNVPGGLTGDRFRIRIASSSGESRMSESYFAIEATASPASVGGVEARTAMLLEVIPTLSTDYVQLRLKGATASGVAAVIDGTGRVVLEYSVTGRSPSLDVSVLPTGQYFVTVPLTDGTSVTARFAIIR